jgi:biopolymer transport protein ExbB/TolQ
MILDILETPINFIKENLTGWVLVVLIILIIYFIGLRNYYIQKERFYDQALYEQNVEEIEETEQNILEAEEKIHSNKKNTTHTQNDNSKKKLKTKKHSKKNKNIEGFEGALPLTPKPIQAFE